MLCCPYVHGGNKIFYFHHAYVFKRKLQEVYCLLSCLISRPLYARICTVNIDESFYTNAGYATNN